MTRGNFSLTLNKKGREAMNTAEKVHKQALDYALKKAERRINKKMEANLADFFGVLKDSKVLKGLEEDTKKIRASSRFRL